MTRHRRHNKRSSRKMKGGVVEDDRRTLKDLGFTNRNINYLFAHNPDMPIEFFQNSRNPPPNNRFYTEEQTPRQIMAEIRNNNESIDNTDTDSNTDTDTDTTVVETFSDIDKNTDTDTYDMLVGGKRKSKRRKSLAKRVKGKMRKTRKVRKMRKVRNRRQQGGNTTGFTTQEETSPIAYLDEREISEANMPRP